MSGPMIVTEPTPCFGNSEPFDLLIDYDGSRLTRLARNEALAMCGQCPVRIKCWSENRDETWVQALLEPRKKPRRRKSCGTPNGAVAHSKKGEQTCEACREAEAQRGRDRKQAAKGVTAELRAAHATYVRLLANGAKRDNLPPELIREESIYQAAKYQEKKAREKADAA